MLLKPAYTVRYIATASKVAANAIVITAFAEAGRQLMQVVMISMRRL